MSGNYFENSVKDAVDIYEKTKSLGEFDDEKNLCIRTSIIGPEIKKTGKVYFIGYLIKEVKYLDLKMFIGVV